MALSFECSFANDCINLVEKDDGRQHGSRLRPTRAIDEPALSSDSSDTACIPAQSTAVSWPPQHPSMGCRWLLHSAKEMPHELQSLQPVIATPNRLESSSMDANRPIVRTLTSVVLAHPGGPCSRIPDEGRTPKAASLSPCSSGHSTAFLSLC